MLRLINAGMYCFVLVVFLICPVMAADKGDLTGDSFVDMDDMSVLADDWLTDSVVSDIAPIDSNSNEVCVADGDGVVNMKDFSLLSENWQDNSLLMSSNALEFYRERLINTSNTEVTSAYPSETDTAYTDWAKTFPPDGTEAWTNGFFPGSLWYMYDLTGDPSFLSLATTWTEPLSSQAFNTVFADHAFVILDSFGHAYRLTDNFIYKLTVLEAAGSLADKYSEIVGCTRSWSWGSWAYPPKFTVTIDNMMNIRILFWSARNDGSASHYDMAVSHAYKTRENHVRSDGSTYHVVVYNEDTGAVWYKTTHQGYSAASTWSRGQAWALYGFTYAYRETNDPNFLDTAKLVADYFVDNLPEDYVPYCDFEAPEIPDIEQDSSAAAIAASGLLELCTLVDDPVYEEKYYNAAKNILTSLCTRNGDGGCLAQDTDGNPTSPSILKRGCVAYGFRRDERGLTYGDYFFIEALMRYKGLTPFAR